MNYFRTYPLIRECEQQLEVELYVADFELQSYEVPVFECAQSIVQAGHDEERELDAIRVMFQHIHKAMNDFMVRNPKGLGFDHEWIIKQIENFSIIKSFSRKCVTKMDYYNLIVMSYRLFTGKVFTTEADRLIARIFTSNVQSMSVGDTLRTLRQAFDGVTGVTECELAKKLVSVYSYLVTQGFLKKYGIELNDEDYSKMEQRAMLSAYSSKKNFYVCVIDTVLFICERIHEFHITGEISAFVNSSGKYTKWLKEADRIINLAPFTGNLQAHNTSYFSYLSDLRNLCEQGEAYAKYLRISSGVEASLVSRKLNTLQLLQNTEITRKAAMQERAQPMGVLVTGHSSIAKSAFTKMLFNYYGGLFDLERGDDFRYVRNPMDEYWSNFDTSKWCVQLDDIAFLNPTKSPTVDSTLQDLLNVVNNVPYVPPQAALEDKGKTPVLAELVIATSNSETLNAQEYFWAPLAVRRRLPFVVSITPKDEFLHENRTFIDPKKIRIEENSFPDLWKITVKKIVPREHGNREYADLVEDRVFTDVKKFLRYFGQACLQHKENQKKAMKTDNSMQNISVCKQCLLPLPHDECAQVQSQLYFIPLTAIFTCFVNWLCAYALFWWFMDHLSDIPFVRRAVFTLVNRAVSQSAAMQFYGRFVDRIRAKKNKVIGAVGLISFLMSAYFIYGLNTVEKKKNSEEFDKMEVQGNVYGTTQSQLKKEESQNVWYNPSIELTRFDLPVATSSLAGCTPEKVRELFHKNCVLLLIRAEGSIVKRTMRAVFTKGHRCITNGHAFKEAASSYRVELLRSPVTQGVNSNIVLTIRREDIAFSSTSDLCMFDVDSIPPVKDITPFWTRGKVDVSRSVMLSRETDGSVTKRNIFNVMRMEDVPVEELKNKFPIYYGTCETETENGMCGSLCVGLTPRGPVILGLHFLGVKSTSGTLAVTLDEIEDLEKQSMISKRPVVQAGDAPMLSCKDRFHVVGNLHYKSIFRYINKGSANLYGTLAGFRPRPRSAVTATPLQKEMLEHYQRDVEYDKPMMSGWEPWRKNVIEMVQPTINYNRATLREAKESFVADIFDGLPEKWEAELVPLDDMAAVNGIPGVKYIDRMSMSTSMGHPWCTTKKKYIQPCVSEEYPEGVEFTEEVMERVRKIEELYKQGKRAYPIFTGHLKDEATPIRKCKIGKTRLFTGAPVDWSIVVRKHLLPFVRLLQKHKFVFEAGPGTVAQSAEWGEIYKYLTAFGKDRMVAGDYGKYDKRMLADFILAAFEIIVEIYRKAGFDEEYLRIIMCIGEDLAFSVCNISGDLVEFFGTNPSGHPLTVVLNSLVNSLYMRYTYVELNPEREARTFKKNVHLFTYGDDNTSGVSRAIDWYNHTAIQRVLESIGVEYTMADKSSVSVPFINIDDVSFLKRKWVWSDDVQNYLCPLEEDSIIKSLTVWVPSKSIDEYAQMEAVVSSACREYFFHGREKFEEKRAFFVRLMDKEPFKFYVKDSTLPTYPQLVEKYLRASEGAENYWIESEILDSEGI